jgi:predicted dehydrogenase
VTELTAVVVGCGAVGSDYDAGRDGEPPLSHAGAYRAHEATKLVAGVDREPEARRRFEQRWSVPAYDEVGAALTEHGPALVSICTPGETHLEVVRKAVGGGAKGLWVEKPLAGTRAEGAELLEAADGIALQVNFLRRFDPLHRRVVEVASPDLVHADMRYSGTLSNFGSHAIDLFRWLAGEVSSVETLRAPDGEPVLFLASERGPTASLSRVQPGTTEIFEAYLFTNRGLMTLTGLGEQLTTWEAAASGLFAGVTQLGPPVTDPERGLVGAMAGGVESLVSHLRSGTPLLCRGDDGLATLAVIEEAER